MAPNGEKLNFRCDILRTNPVYFDTVTFWQFLTISEFQPKFFQAKVTVNLTVLLVLTTLFIGNLDSLPKTSSLKMMDIWLIFTLLGGLPYMTSAKFLDLLTHTPVTFTNQLILFLLSAFWGHPSPHPLRTSYMETP